MMNKPVLATVGMFAVLSLAACSTGTSSDASEEEAASSGELFSQELHDALPGSVRDSGTLRLVGDPNAPWRVVDADGETLIGFQADISLVFEEILGVEITNDMTSGIPSVKLGVQSERHDAAFGPLLDTAKTEEDLSFIVYTSTRPTFTFAASADPLTSILDLCGTTVAVVDGSVPTENAIASVSEACVSEGKAEVTSLPLADQNATLVAVESERAESAAMGIASAAYARTEQPDRFDFYMADADEFPTDYAGMAFLPENTELIDAFMGAWEIAFEEGVYAELMEKCGMEDAMVDSPLLNPETS